MAVKRKKRLQIWASFGSRNNIIARNNQAKKNVRNNIFHIKSIKRGGKLGHFMGVANGGFRFCDGTRYSTHGPAKSASRTTKNIYIRTPFIREQFSASCSLRTPTFLQSDFPKYDATPRHPCPKSKLVNPVDSHCFAQWRRPKQYTPVRVPNGTTSTTHFRQKPTMIKTRQDCLRLELLFIVQMSNSILLDAATLPETWLL